MESFFYGLSNDIYIYIPMCSWSATNTCSSIIPDFAVKELTVFAKNTLNPKEETRVCIYHWKECKKTFPSMYNMF